MFNEFPSAVGIIWHVFRSTLVPFTFL